MEEFAAANLDDVLIFSDSWSEHLGHLTQVLNSIRSAGLTVRAKKCQLGMDQCCYLGHIVHNESERLKAVESFLHQKQRKLRILLGLTGYYQKFITSYSIVACTFDRPNKEGSQFS